MAIVVKQILKWFNYVKLKFRTSWQLLDDDLSSEETGSTTFVYIKEGTYNATLRVTDNDGFTDTDYRLITVSEDDGDGGGGSIPSVSMIPALISIGLIAIFRRK